MIELVSGSALESLNTPIADMPSFVVGAIVASGGSTETDVNVAGVTVSVTGGLVIMVSQRKVMGSTTVQTLAVTAAVPGEAALNEPP